MSLLVHIFKFKLLSFLKISFDGKLMSILKNAGTASVYCIFGVGVYIFTYNLIEYLLEDVKIGLFLFHRFISAILFVFFLAVNIGNALVSFSTLYRSKEVSFLITKPLAYYKLFTIKFLDNFFYSSVTLLLIILTALAGYGSYFNMGIDFYIITLFFQIIPFMMIAASLGVIVLLTVLKLAKHFGIKKIIAVLASVYIISLIFFYKLTNPVLLVSQVMEYYPDINRYFGFLDNKLVTLLPNFWISESMYWMVANNYLQAFPYLLLQVSLALIFFTAAVLLAKRWYYETWISSMDISFSSGRKKRGKNKIFGFGKKSFFKPQLEVLIKKEFWQFFREPSQWIHLIIILLLIFVFAGSIASIDVKMLYAYNAEMRTLIYLVVFLFNVFLIATLALRFVFPLISIEGQAYWKIKSSPLSNTKLMFTKFITLFLLILLIGQAINYFSHFRYPFILTFISSINTALITITLVSLNFGMGSIFVNYKERNPIRIASSQGASITFLFTLIYLAFLMIVLFIPVYDFFNPKNSYGEAAGKLPAASLIIGVVSIIVTLISINIGRRSLKRDF
jgi:ABC-2 type transport system permease protein